MVTMVLHDQKENISSQIAFLDNKIESLGFPPHNVHIGPLIRRESIYLQYEDYSMRTGLLNAIYHFTRQLKILYACVAVDKRECKDFVALNSKLSRELFAKMEIPSEHSELEDYTYVVNEI